MFHYDSQCQAATVDPSFLLLISRILWFSRKLRSRHTAQCTVHINYTVQNGTVCNTQVMAHSSQFTVLGTQFIVHSAQCTVHSAQRQCSGSGLFFPCSYLRASVVSKTCQEQTVRSQGMGQGSVTREGWGRAVLLGKLVLV